MGSWIHKEVSNHAGFETAFRHSLDYCFIIYGYSLFEELGRACVLCTKLRSRFINTARTAIPEPQPSGSHNLTCSDPS